ncbi:MAG TPA: hypothetical protein VK912_03140 [Longimicrobiales bacterium]|nr:hypothetical protein [Longimicrobiales bacterium]
MRVPGEADVRLHREAHDGHVRCVLDIHHVGRATIRLQPDLYGDVVAEQAAAAGDAVAAAGWWRRLAAAAPGNSRVALRLMESLEAAGDRAGAIRHGRVHTVWLREELDAGPEPDVAHTSLAISLWWQRKLPGADRELRRALELNPGHVTARAWYSVLLAGMDRLPEARRQAQRALELDPVSHGLAFRAAWVLFLAREYEASNALLAQALEINPKLPAAYAQLALNHALDGHLRTRNNLRGSFRATCTTEEVHSCQEPSSPPWATSGLD